MKPTGKIPAKESSYQATRLLATRGGAIAGTSFELFFVFNYWLSGYPAPAVWFQLIATIISLTAIGIAYHTKYTQLAAQLVTGALFLSLIGPGLYTGGIDSSVMVWVTFVSVAATVMGGIASGLFWGSASIAATVGLFLLNHVSMIDFTTRPPQSIDRMTELIACILGVGLAILLNERIKNQVMTSLDDAKAQLTELANTDPLTHVFNRRYFIDQAQTELRRGGDGYGFSILLLDIDHFKKVNDTYGHAIGDEILNGVVFIGVPMLRKDDILARLGGEEFIVLLPHTSLETALEIAERLRAVIESTPIQSEAGLVSITVSIGVSSYSPQETISLRELIRQADDAMYKAKDAGRNRVMAWT